VADEAAVTPQAAYRYFADIHDLILLAVRRVEAVEHERLLTLMTVEEFDVDLDLARAAVGFVIQSYQRMAGAPLAMRFRIARDYHDISYNVLWNLAETTHTTMVQRSDPIMWITVARLAAGLTAVVAVTKSLFLRDTSLLNQPDTHHMLVAIFLGALRGLDHGP
jgi:AcrR family transcriptional regulator